MTSKNREIENARKACHQDGAQILLVVLFSAHSWCREQIYVFMSLFQRHPLSYNWTMSGKIVMICWAMESVPNEVYLATLRSNRMKLDTENGLLLGNYGYKVNMTVSSLVISLKNPVPEIVLHGQ